VDPGQRAAERIRGRDRTRPEARAGHVVDLERHRQLVGARRALPRVHARLAGIWGGHDAFTGHHVAESQQVLAGFDPDFEARVIEPAGHWVNYEAADQVNALLTEWLARPAR